jgi:hypothetical protein
MQGEVNKVTLSEVIAHTSQSVTEFWQSMCMSKTLFKIMFFLTPILEKLENLIGRGGNLRYTGVTQKNPDI